MWHYNSRITKYDIIIVDLPVLCFFLHISAARTHHHIGMRAEQATALNITHSLKLRRPSYPPLFFSLSVPHLRPTLASSSPTRHLIPAALFSLFVPHQRPTLALSSLERPPCRSPARPPLQEHTHSGKGKAHTVDARLQLSHLAPC